MFTSVVVSLFFVGAAFAQIDENQAKLRFYHGSFNNHTELTLDEAEKIFSTSWYDPEKITVFYTHGFTGRPEGPAVTAVINAYLKHGKSNVVLLNWDKLAAIALPGLLNSYMNWGIPNAVQLGTDFADILVKLSNAGLNLNKTHFIGHSLGAQVFGIAGYKITEKGIQLPWITGLDPATGFDMKPIVLRLSAASARYVSVIHSDPSKYGSKRELGTVDFWPNFRGFGPVVQPGCPGSTSTRFSDEDFCNHNRSWELLIDTLIHPGTLKASYARNFRTWKRYTKAERQAIVMEIGVFYEKPVPGSYFFVTSGKSPFGLGIDGL